MKKINYRTWKMFACMQQQAHYQWEKRALPEEKMDKSEKVINRNKIRSNS